MFGPFSGVHDTILQRQSLLQLQPPLQLHYIKYTTLQPQKQMHYATLHYTNHTNYTNYTHYTTPITLHQLHYTNYTTLITLH